MYPANIVTPVTLYMHRKDPATGSVTCERAVLQGVFWNDDANAVYKKTGQATVTYVNMTHPGMHG